MQSPEAVDEVDDGVLLVGDEDVADDDEGVLLVDDVDVSVVEVEVVDDVVELVVEAASARPQRCG